MELKHSDNNLHTRIQTLIDASFTSAIELYQQLHQIPEIGLQEHQTSTFVRQYLSKIEGVEVLPAFTALPTAVIAQITPQEFKETILLRCELDALPFKEESNLEFSSQNDLHHACGHDGHMTMMLLAASIIVKERANLNKKVILCFQPGEEGRKGASKLFEACPSLLEAVKNCYALHFHNAIRPGWIKLDPGPVTSLSNRFCIEIEGKAAHCLAPQAGIDANYIGCSLVSSLYSLIGTTIDPMEGGSLVILKIQGGSKVAMVSSHFSILDSYEKIKNRISNLSQSMCSSYGAKATVSFSQMNYRPVVNNEQLVNNLKNKIVKNGQIQISHGQKSFAGQDFCQFSQKVPSCYVSIGSALPDSIDPQTNESIYPAHSPRHKLDPKGILYGLKVWMMIVFD